MLTTMGHRVQGLPGFTDQRRKLLIPGTNRNCSLWPVDVSRSHPYVHLADYKGLDAMTNGPESREDRTVLTPRKLEAAKKRRGI